ncbi:hypothetical protein DERP_014376 [Dermatophagoides pteronyssinus]|uniref:Uncharacterized protein n=1 Tax=Dermatophagoides pteronyssinus TaxID=6956 RepID=A0ABQ8IV17_DERPT|nr:hypothetical protein DERP_014376 [Dermatophagoides pteronyssinus]
MFVLNSEEFFGQKNNDHLVVAVAVVVFAFSFGGRRRSRDDYVEEEEEEEEAETNSKIYKLQNATKTKIDSNDKR